MNSPESPDDQQEQDIRRMREISQRANYPTHVKEGVATALNPEIYNKDEATRLMLLILKLSRKMKPETRKYFRATIKLFKDLPFISGNTEEIPETHSAIAADIKSWVEGCTGEEGTLFVQALMFSGELRELKVENPPVSELARKNLKIQLYPNTWHPR